MKNLLILLLHAFSISSYAQNWEFFPLDSLRCYDIGSHIPTKGIAFNDYHYTDYTQDQILINLNDFSKLREVPTEHFYPYYALFYITGNSILGNSISVDSKHSKLYFYNDSIPGLIQDSILFANNNQVGHRWTFLETEKLIATAVNLKFSYGETSEGQDSIKTIRVSVKRKDSPNDSFGYDFKIGKRFGLINLVDFDAFRHFEHKSYFTHTIDLLPYYELTEKEFFEIKPGTEIHGEAELINTSDSLVSISNRYIYFREDEKLIEKTTVNQLVSKTVEGKRVDIVRPLSETETEYVQKRNGGYIFNPLPSTFNNNRHDDYAVSQPCLGTYKTNVFDGVGTIQRVNKDTAAVYFWEGMQDTKRSSYLAGVGLIYKPGFQSSIETIVQYAKTPNCEYGQRFTGTNSIRDSQFQNVKVYPNPVSNYLIIKNLTIKTAKIQLIDLLGKSTVLSLINDQIDVTEVVSGVYLLRISEGDNSFTERVIIQH